MKRIAHLTSVHPRSDMRIFSKECVSLASTGYEVSLILADGQGDAVWEDVAIYDVGTPNSRLDRMLKTTRRVLKKARALDCEIYHLHDPELIPIGVKLKNLGKRVIFDAHEDVAQQMFSRHYLNRVAKHVLAWTYSAYEKVSCAKFDAVVTATPFIRNKFLPINPTTIDVKNFPLLGELECANSWECKPMDICYVGGLAAVRGAREMVQAMELVGASVRLNLVGRFNESDIEREVKSLGGWENVNELGHLNRSEVRDVLARSRAGLVPLHPITNYLDSLPVKMFEYMSAGIPVIASHFPLWREIIEGNQCGLCVDPLDPKAIASAVDYLIENPAEARLMGENGKRAVMEKYNWDSEAAKLRDLYLTVLGTAVR